MMGHLHEHMVHRVHLRTRIKCGCCSWGSRCGRSGIPPKAGRLKQRRQVGGDCCGAPVSLGEVCQIGHEGRRVGGEGRR